MKSEELSDGTWRLNVTKSLIDDFTNIKNLEIVRED